MTPSPHDIILHQPGVGWLHFRHPRHIIAAHTLEGVLPALRDIEASVETEHLYAAGWIAYEAAPAFDPALTAHPPTGELPLLWFGLYSAPVTLSSLPAPAASHHLGPFAPSVSRQDYDAAIAAIKTHIARGETYQVNFTFRLRLPFEGDAWSLFHSLVRAQGAGYAAYVDAGRFVVCSASPELFFTQTGDLLESRPMKGTAPRGRTLAEDEALAAQLRASEKNRAENVMIVDMIRNDLGRIAETGSVRVPALFSTERYPTLWQMTSTVQARSRGPLSQTLAALFPCASITGAPKVSTMRIIAALEDTPRGVYTGAIGFMGPGRTAQFNVAIRTAVIDRASGQAEYGLGGGVVWDSTPGGEYDEALLKARVLTAPPRPDFQLLETLLWTPSDGYWLKERHIARMVESAAYFGFPAAPGEIAAYLDATAAHFHKPQRVRLLMDEAGRLSHESTDFTPADNPPPIRAALAAQPVHSRDIFLFHKTTHRQVYDHARAARPGVEDVLLFN
ncbi:MAG: aminodeoxychorismate synthase component I, partial [Anaerolineales bacterium]